MPTITIAIQSYKNPEMLKVCLDAVVRHTADRDDCAIVVADSATEEDTALMMREDYPEITFVPHTANVGFGAMVNACIDVAQDSTYIFFINADTIMEAETIPTLLAFMEAHPDVALIGPAQKNFNHVPENTRFRFYKPQTILYRRTFLKYCGFARRHLARFEMKDVETKEPYPVPWVIGSAMFVRTAAITAVGVMDRRFFMYMEDVDWCRRFWEAGWKVYYHPQCSIYHFYGKGSAQHGIVRGLLFHRLTWVHLASGFKYFRKYRGTALPAITPSHYTS